MTSPPQFRFCPFCGQSLGVRHEEGYTRSFCEGCHWTHYPRVAMSASAIIEQGSSVVLVRRKRDPFKGTWMFPSGFLEYGEHPEDALAREVKEETGLVATAATLLGVFQSRDDHREPGHIIFFYKVSVSPDGPLETDAEENDAIGWFSVHDPPEIAWEVHKVLMARLQSEA